MTPAHTTGRRPSPLRGLLAGLILSAIFFPIARHAMFTAGEMVVGVVLGVVLGIPLLALAMTLAAGSRR